MAAHLPYPRNHKFPPRSPWHTRYHLSYRNQSTPEQPCSPYGADSLGQKKNKMISESDRSSLGIPVASEEGVLERDGKEPSLGFRGNTFQAESLEAQKFCEE